jgi:hypothetical protein
LEISISFFFQISSHCLSKKTKNLKPSPITTLQQFSLSFRNPNNGPTFLAFLFFPGPASGAARTLLCIANKQEFMIHTRRGGRFLILFRLFSAVINTKLHV